MNIIYYIVSILSIFFYVMSVQFKKKKQILIFQILASIFYLLVYIMVGAWSGVSIKIIDSLKNIIFINYEDKKSNKNKDIPIGYLLFFIGLLIFVSIIFYDGVLSLLPLIINIALFISTYFKNPKYIRLVMIITGICWGIYNLYVAAYLLIIGNVLEVTSAIISVFRFKKEDNKIKKKS